MLNVKNIALAGLAALAFTPSVALATPVYGTDASADLTDSRSTPGGIGLLGAGTATLEWVITDNNDGTLNYSYKLTTTAQNHISHFILDLSDDCTGIGSCFGTPTLGTDDALSESGIVFGSFAAGGSNPGMPGTIVGVKLNVTSTDGIFEFSFDSNRVPVWGDFYSKGGNPDSQPTKAYAIWNIGLADHSDGDVGHFIVVPDSQIVSDPCPDCGVESVPEPATLSLFGLGLAGLALRRRKRS